MEILGGETVFVLFVDLRKLLNRRICNFLLSIKTTIHDEITGDMVEPKLKDIYSQFSSI